MHASSQSQGNRLNKVSLPKLQSKHNTKYMILYNAALFC